MEQHEDNQQEKKDNFIKRGYNAAKNKVNNAAMMAQADMQSAMIEQLLPFVKKIIPTVETNLKKYLGGVDDGIEKIVVIKKRKDNDKIEILIMNENGTLIGFKPDWLPENVMLNKIGVDEYVESFVTGNFDGAVKSGI